MMVGGTHMVRVEQGSTDAVAVVGEDIQAGLAAAVVVAMDMWVEPVAAASVVDT
jgi:hypothetical protein